MYEVKLEDLVRKDDLYHMNKQFLRDFFFQIITSKVLPKGPGEDFLMNYGSMWDNINEAVDEFFSTAILQLEP